VALKRELQANSKLATLKDDDDRLPLHGAVAQGHLDVVSILAQRKDFDPDAKVTSLSPGLSNATAHQLDIRCPVTDL
jgi:26S proteasome non-ATPase regulatory subunit 10